MTQPLIKYTDPKWFNLINDYQTNGMSYPTAELLT